VFHDKLLAILSTSGFGARARRYQKLQAKFLEQRGVAWSSLILAEHFPALFNQATRHFTIRKRPFSPMIASNLTKQNEDR